MSLSDVFSVFTEGYMPSIILATIAVLLLIRQRLALDLDPREPPILKPRVPYIGHIIGMLKYQGAFYDQVYARKPMPIATLPMLNGKIYMINDPIMAQNAFRHKNLSFDPFVLEFSKRMLGVSDETMKPVSFAGDEKTPGFLTEFVREIHAAMLGKGLHEMNQRALKGVADTLNGYGATFEADGLYYWLRNMMTVATSDALLGAKNPIKADSGLVGALWDFEGNMLGLLLNVFPSVTFPKGYQGRQQVQNALVKYYSARHDLEPDVSEMAKVRAAVMRRRGISDTDIGRFEIALIHVSTANAIPTLFWQLCYITSSPSSLAPIRTELESILTTVTLPDGKREIIIDTSKFESHCPILVSSYRETIRLVNSQLGARRAMEDTLLSDGKKTFLLRKGCDIQIPAGIPHMSASTWGPDSASFNPRRFLSPEDKGDASAKARAEDREQKKSYFPFGGGKHLCPGRAFAFSEILGTVAVLVAGFEVKDERGGQIVVPEVGRARLGEGICKPTGKGLEMGVRLERRKGWEDVVWKFAC